MPLLRRLSILMPSENDEVADEVINDVKARCDDETCERGMLLGKYRNLEHELDGACYAF